LFAQADAPEELRRNLAGLAVPLLLPKREAVEEEVRLMPCSPGSGTTATPAGC